MEADENEALTDTRKPVISHVGNQQFSPSPPLQNADDNVRLA